MADKMHFRDENRDGSPAAVVSTNQGNFETERWRGAGKGRFPLEANMYSIYIHRSMEPAIEWSLEKNAELKERHGFGFERVLVALAERRLLDDRTHPNSERYGHQRQLIVEIDAYAWIVPFVQVDQTIFLKTMFPSRKATKKYLERSK